MRLTRSASCKQWATGSFWMDIPKWKELKLLYMAGANSPEQPSHRRFQLDRDQTYGPVLSGFQTQAALSVGFVFASYLTQLHPKCPVRIQWLTTFDTFYNTLKLFEIFVWIALKRFSCYFLNWYLMKNTFTQPTSLTQYLSHSTHLIPTPS